MTPTGTPSRDGQQNPSTENVLSTVFAPTTSGAS